MNEQIQAYVSSERARGVTDDAIKNALLEKGWQEVDVNSIFNVPIYPAGSATLPQSNELKGTWDLILEVWELMKARPWQYILISGIPFLWAIPFIAVLMIMGVGMTQFEIMSAFSSDAMFGTLMALGAVFALGAVVLFTIAQIANILFLTGEALTVMDAFLKSPRYFLSYIWVSILSFLLVLLGALFFIFPAFLLAIWFSFANVIVVTEHLHGLGTLKQSRVYVRGRWWSMFWRLIISGLFVTLLSIIAGIAIGLVSAFFPGEIASNLGSIVIQSASGAFSGIFLYRLYVNARDTATQPVI